MKRITILLGLLGFFIAVYAQTAIIPSMGNGTLNNPYQIATWQNLYWLSQTSSVWNKHFIQINDIDFSQADPEISTWANNTGWTPIGNLSIFFTGSYNGNGKTINGLYINKPNTNTQALFGYLYYSAEIRNLGLTNTDVLANKDVSGLVAENHGNVLNCYSIGVVNGNENTGVLVGANYSNISKCYTSGAVYGFYHTGGLVGWNENSSLDNCYSSVNVTAGSFTGGLSGGNYQCAITNSYSNGFVIGTTYSGGLLGGATRDDDVIINCFWDIETSGYTHSAGGTGKTSEEMKSITTYSNAGWDFSQIWDINSSQNNGYPFLRFQNSVNTDDLQIPISNKNIILHDAYPNPFNPSTTISFDLQKNDHISIAIYNSKGQKIKDLVNNTFSPGKYRMIWDGKNNDHSDCGSGIYFFSIKGKETVITKKMILIK